jgi:hypothetical protein
MWRWNGCVQMSPRLWDGQVPSLILFENGKEAARIPGIPKKDTLVSKIILRRVRLHLPDGCTPHEQASACLGPSTTWLAQY